MCKALNDALGDGKSNLNSLAQRIGSLKVSCKYKGAFMRMSDNRGFRFTDDTLSQMEAIGSSKSEVCIHLLDGKQAGLIVPYTLATQLDTDKDRALVLQELEKDKKRVTEINILKAILTIKNRFS